MMHERLTGRFRLVPGIFGLRVEVQVARVHTYTGGYYAAAPMGADYIKTWRRSRPTDIDKLGGAMYGVDTIPD